jgi:sugar phosphate isomerase/epimerase
MSEVSRRRFVSTLAAGSAYLATRPRSAFASPAASKFKVAVISDEISDDFDLACSIIARDFGLHWVELRGMWGKNLQRVSDDEIVRAQGILAKYELQVTDIASPLFKVDWPGATKSKYSMAQDLHGAAESTLAQQDEVLARSIALAKRFKTNKVRCFDFWRIDDIAEHRPAIDDHLRSAAEVARKDGVMLLLENEFECNTATGREAAATLAGVVAPNFALNWDPGNAVMRGEIDAYPGGWNALPKNRIHHCHCKNAVSDDKGGYKWSPVNIGYIDWTKQFRALKELGYNDAVSLETHWRGGGTPEASTRISWAGMKSCLVAAGAL